MEYAVATVGLLLVVLIIPQGYHCSRQVPPKISPFSFPNNATVGQRGTATCTATEGDQPLTFRWLKNGRRIDVGDSSTITDNADFSVLKIQSLDVNSSGNYTCVVSNLVGSASRSATLTVHGRQSQEERLQSSNGTLILTTTSRSDNGEYKCEASNGIGQSLQKTVTVTVKPMLLNSLSAVVVIILSGFTSAKPTVPPRITPFSFATKLVAGQRATVTCSTYEGSQPLTFVWLKDGSVLSKGENVEKSEGEAHSTLSISPLSPRNSGNYTCVASNAAGSDSASSSLIVYAPPKVLPFVIPKNLLVGESVSFICSAASGSKPLKFVWIKDDATVHRGTALRITDSADYSTLTIESLKTSDAGNYTCVVSNSGGTVSHSDVLHVKVEPADVTVTAGDAITLKCNGTGFPPPKISWTKEGVQASENSADGVIQIASASKKDEGHYKCHISNDIGADLYKTVTVTVKLSTKISPFIFSKNLLVGERTSVMCATTSGDQPFRFSWMKDGRPLQQSTKINVASNPQYSALTIDKLDLKDAGNYTCSVSNAHGTVSYTDTLEVRAPPTWVAEPVDVHVKSGESVEIPCKAEGFPPPSTTWLKNAPPKILPFAFPRTLTVGETTTLTCTTTAGDEPFKYLWLKDGSVVHPGVNVKIVTSPEFSVFKIDKLTLENAGNYTCVVSNAGGTVSHASTLEIRVPPSIPPFQFPKNLEVQQRISVICTISVGEKPLQFAWLKDGSALASGSRNVRIVDNAESSTLHIDVLTLESAGNYTCSVTNKAGYTSYTAPLAVHGDETPVTGAQKDGHGASSILIRNVAPKIQPFSFPATLNVGERSGTLCIVTAGDKPLTFSWFKDESTLTTNDNVKVTSNAEFSNLNFGSLEATHIGNYTCSVRNSVGSASFTAFLAVHAPPSWTEAPGDKELTAGETGSLTCKAKGFPSPTIRWFKTEKPKLQPLVFTRSRIRTGESASALCALVASDHDVKFRWFKENVEIGGAVPNVKVKNDKKVSVLTVEPATLQSAGNYTCTAENNYGHDANSATLVVEEPGKDASKTSIATASGSTALIVPKTAKDVEGKYVCEADNSIGTALKKIVFVKVKSPPVWISEPRDVSAVSGSNVTVQCMASGSPPPKMTWTRSKEPPKVNPFLFTKTLSEGQSTAVTCTVTQGSKPVQLQWLKDGHEVVGSGAVKLIKHETIVVLSIEPVKVADSGNYTCVARNEYGYDRYTSALQVNAPPKWEVEPQDVVLKRGETVELQCKAVGYPLPDVRWLKEGTELKRLSEDRAQVLQNGTLVIRNATSEDSGKYSCLASNGIGAALTKTLSVLVKSKPAFGSYNSHYTSPNTSVIASACSESLSQASEIQF
ncbi:hemicentin-1-like [Rhipicephalus sanguineus]|uniref:hemicentin-1-like n=1 Tax=Rhipicephalus sanguineus TaxID=34632 RepID=UPI0020C58C4A|nr:hemicentin-1-like [Rhipicephalus sanguineus]